MGVLQRVDKVVEIVFRNAEFLGELLGKSRFTGSCSKFGPNALMERWVVKTRRPFPSHRRLDDQRDLAFDRITRSQVFRELFGWQAQDLLVQLGELAAQRHAPAGEHTRYGPHARCHPMRRLVEHECSIERLQAA